VFAWLLLAGHFGFGQFKSDYGKDTVLIKYDNKRINGIKVKDKKDGLWFYYDDDGRVISKGNYVHDVKQGVWEVRQFRSATDTVITTCIYSNGNADGVWTETYIKGNDHWKIVTEYSQNKIIKSTSYNNGIETMDVNNIGQYLASSSVKDTNSQHLPYSFWQISKEHALYLKPNSKRGIASESGIVYLVENDKRTITAYDNTKVLWKSDVIGICGKPAVGEPEVRFIQLEKDRLSVSFGKHCSAYINITDGKVTCLGCN